MKPISTFLICFGLLSGFVYGTDLSANLGGFDKDSIQYVKSERVRRAAIAKDHSLDPDIRAEIQQFRIFEWLGPFHWDLTPYLDKPESIATEKWRAQRLGVYFKDEWLPDGWAEPEMKNVKSVIPNDASGGIRSYRGEQTSVDPATAYPNGPAFFFRAWEHRKGSVKISALTGPQAKSEILLVAHKDDGFGEQNPSVESLTGIATRYFHLPPKGMNAPKDWKPHIQIQRKDGRFVSGALRGDYSGEWPKLDSYGGSAYGGGWTKADPLRPNIGYFYFDGFNFAILVTPVRGQNGTMHATAIGDMDWDRVEKDEAERSAKPKSK